LIEQWAKDKGFNLKKATYMVQGFGKVGSWTARLLKPYGAKLLAVEGFTGAIASPEGIDPFDLTNFVQKSGSISATRKLSRLTIKPSCKHRRTSLFPPLWKTRSPPTPHHF
jgi:glutamate dehydrogenase/leucine dehydrogenase